MCGILEGDAITERERIVMKMTLAIVRLEMMEMMNGKFVESFIETATKRVEKELER